MEAMALLGPAGLLLHLLGADAVRLSIWDWTRGSGAGADHATVNAASLARLSSLPLLSAITFGGSVVVTACAGICIVFLEYFPPKSGTTRAHRRIIVLIQIHL